MQLSQEARVTKGSHFFKLTDLTDRMRNLVYEFTRPFIQVDATRSNPNSPNHQPPKQTVYAAASKDRREFRFHIGAYDRWLEFVKNRGFTEQQFHTEVLELADGDEYAFQVREGWTAREDQVPPIRYIVEPNGPKNRLVGLQTGQGKGFIMMKAMEELAVRTVVCVRPMFIEKWSQELQQILEITGENIMVIRGSKDLKSFLAMCEYPEMLENIGVVIISNKTMLMWLKLYDEFKHDTRDLGYACVPDELFAHARAGVRIIDEVHMDFHFNFRLDLYTNVKKSVSASASLLNDDPFTTKMQNLAYPMSERFNGGALNKYTAAYAVMYYLDPTHKVRTSEFGSSSYSHNAYEACILRQPRFFSGYAKLIGDTVRIGYIKDYKPGDKCVVFCSSRDMCTRISEHLQQIYPHLNVKRFVEGDDYQLNYKDPDIRVTTVGSGGTGHDVKQLTCCILTIGLKSTQSNIQVFGRLRFIPGYTTRFYFLSCHDIKKHDDYFVAKKKLMLERAVSFNSIQYNQRV